VFPGPAARRCPLLANLDTITRREGQSAIYVVATIGVQAVDPTRSLREIWLGSVILGERQQRDQRDDNLRRRRAFRGGVARLDEDHLGLAGRP
jgi:hypothetical protein